MNKYPVYTVFFIGVMLVLNSCSSGKTLTSTQQEYLTFSAAIECIFQPDGNAKKQTVKGQLRIVRDQIVQISFRVPIVNTEAAKITVTPSHFTFIDRRNRVFIEDSLDRLRLLIHSEHNFQSLQKLFTSQKTVKFEEDGAQIVFRISKPVLNKEFEINLEQPSKYTQITLEQLINSMQTSE